jgi:citrate lyase subunit beta/citryl-CoA lyase
MQTSLIHPREALFDAGEAPSPALAVCDHYAGVEARMRKSLALQAELGPVFDVTLDGEDGAPIGGELEHAHLIGELVASPANRFERVGARVHPIDHPVFAQEVDTLLRLAGDRLAYLTVPKPRGLADVNRACDEIDHLIRVHGHGRRVPLHFLIETHGALREVDAIAAHPRIESLSFGLMDFVSAHRGAIPGRAMSMEGQFSHPLVLRAKLEIAAACHAHGKTPSHCVVTEFGNRSAIQEAAQKACRELGYTRMWSIHPNQIRPIVDAFAPTAAEVDLAVDIITLAQAGQWAPMRHRDTLHDRASYRYYWQVLERAQRTGQALPAQARERFFGTP